MEGKIVIMSALVVSLVVLGQIQVEAKSCCPSTATRNAYNICRLGGTIPRPICAATTGCKIVDGKCPKGYEKDILENTSGDDVVNEYCKLGCVSSVCDVITTLKDSDASEVVNGAVEKCTNACSDFCTKGSINAVETA